MSFLLLDDVSEVVPSQLVGQSTRVAGLVGRACGA
jgi:hypothetical protein